MVKAPPVHCQTCQSRGEGIFCDLSAEHLKELDAAKTTNHYKPHQVIFHEGNQPQGLHCVSSGKIKIYKMDAQGHQQIVRLAGPGDVMGYRCLLTNEGYSATAETLEEATICFINKETFLHIIETHPVTAFHILSSLAKDLGRAENQTMNMVHKNIRERLAELFLVFHKKYGKKTSQGIELDILLSREEMAELIGTTQESVIRLISEFKQDGLIAVDGRHITLLNIKKIMDLANLPD
ncbi:MAG: Crp/Fnr family transcriptional regulator [Deltaproteobacteria bacterium]|nr:Crp/Fnr family transcriptional regulator [Deltaproteobacteria bacterium]